ncbi:OB-fold nucleic acid binding domain-containing protein, partial [Gilvimarinus sp. 1_MG-2023]|nr:lysine--tRNA ligase [Gilvimarinus sp. 1_MG-2023]
ANGHPNDFRRKHLAGDLKAEHGDKDKATLAEEKHPVVVAGRVMRRGGPFVGIQDSSGAIQFYLAKPKQKESEIWPLLDIGDIVGVSGT